MAKSRIYWLARRRLASKESPMNVPVMTKRHIALIPAAGVGARMAAGSPKQYLNIAGKPMLRHALDAFLSSPLIAHI